ncbi:hypothetical protein V2J09_004607 [Rumex salicifolius]
MASIVANLPPTVLGLSKSIPKSFSRPANCSTWPGHKRRLAIVVKAMGEASESSSLSIVESVQNVWDKPEDRVAVLGLGFAAVVALWTSANIVSAVDKLPVLPGVLELIGIFYSSWFVYRYLLFKPDREELVRTMNRSVSNILGQ